MLHKSKQKEQIKLNIRIYNRILYKIYMYIYDKIL